MYFDYDRNSEDSDDDIYKGELPADFEAIKEEKCRKCTANEKKLGADVPKTVMTKKDFKSLRKALYKQMVDEGLLKYFVEMLTSLCPNTVQDLKTLGSLLTNPKPGEITDLTERYEIVKKVAERMKRLDTDSAEKEPLKIRLDSIIQETLEKKKMQKEKLKIQQNTPRTSAIIIRDHICNPNCHWCQLHCNSFAKLKGAQNKMCDCQCVMLDLPVREFTKC